MSYASDEDILVLSRGRTVQASIEIGDFVIDIDHKGFVTGLEILDASRVLRLAEAQLKQMKNATMTINYKQDYVLIMLFFTIKNKEKEITIPLTVDLGHRTVTQQRVSFAAA